MLSSKRDKVLKQRTSIIRLIIKKFALNINILFAALFCLFLLITTISYRAPIQNTVDQALIRLSSIAVYIPNIYTTIANYIGAAQENEYLKLKISNLTSKVSDYEILKSENEELKNLLIYKSNYTFDYITTTYLALSPDLLDSTILLPIGQDHNIQTNQAIIDKNNLIGVIYSVNEKSSRAKLLYSYGVKVPIKLLSSNIRCLAIGNGYLMSLKYLPNNSSTPLEGEIALTSGDADVFPAGIKVGIVIRGEDNSFLIKPFFEQKNGSFVSVVRNKIS